MKRYLIYKIVNDVNGMYYYGKHITENVNDSYFGSGVFLKRAIKKYGIEHFHKEILFIFDNETDMNNKEREIVNESEVNNPNCYNIMIGGEGGDTWTKSGRHHSDETRRKISENSKNNWKNPLFREKMSKKLHESYLKKKENSPDSLKEEYRLRGLAVSKALNGRNKSMSKEHRKSISNGLKTYYDNIGRKHKPRKPLPYKSINASGKMIKVHKETEEHTIYECDKDWYISNGWSFGRNPLNKKSRVHSIEAQNSSSGKGKRIIHNKVLQQVKRIEPNELQIYLDSGWECGYLNKKNLRSGLERPAEGS